MTSPSADGAVASLPPRAATGAYRMRDLCQLSGLERQTIHFYIQEGLLPEGKKTGRNMAYYGEEHLDRLRLIKQLQDERFLPLRAIRAILGGTSGGFSSEQRRLIADVKERLSGGQQGRALVGGSTELVSVKSLAEAHNVSTEDIDELIEVGLLSAEGSGRTRRVRSDDAWLVGAYADLARAGLDKRRGFSARDLAIVDEAVSALFMKERELFFERIVSSDGGAEEIAGILERALPILSELIARLHTHKARDLFALAAADEGAALSAAHERKPKRAGLERRGAARRRTTGGTHS